MDPVHFGIRRRQLYELNLLWGKREKALL